MAAEKLTPLLDFKTMLINDSNKLYYQARGFAGILIDEPAVEPGYKPESPTTPIPVNFVKIAQINLGRTAVFDYDKDGHDALVLPKAELITTQKQANIIIGLGFPLFDPDEIPKPDTISPKSVLRSIADHIDGSGKNSYKHMTLIGSSHINTGLEIWRQVSFSSGLRGILGRRTSELAYTLTDAVPAILSDDRPEGLQTIIDNLM
jgi:hypothetical protein